MTPVLGAPDEAAVAAFRERLDRNGRARLEPAFDPDYALHLAEAARWASYNTVTTRSTGHVDMPAAWLASLDPTQKTKLGQALQTSARERFQYLFDNYALYDLYEAGTLASPWRELVAFLNGEAFLGRMRALTGEPRIALADAQLTRYRPGHFLTGHDDSAEGKNRFFAYVINLSFGWTADWGGLLAFYGADGDVEEAFTPRFNTMNLLRTPQPHAVTQVSLFAGADRVSVTGWLRGAG